VSNRLANLSGSLPKLCKCLFRFKISLVLEAFPFSFLEAGVVAGRVRGHTDDFWFTENRLVIIKISFFEDVASGQVWVGGLLLFFLCAVALRSGERVV